MNKELNDEIFSKVNETIENYKKQVDNYIEKLTSIKNIAPTPEVANEIENLINNLKSSRQINTRNFGLNKKTKIVSDDFFVDSNNYKYNSLIDKNIDKELSPLEKKTGLEKANVANKIVKLKEKKGKIQKKQIKIADEIIIKKLNQYKEKKNIDFRKYDKLVVEYNKKLHQFAEQKRSEIQYDKLDNSLKDFIYTDKNSVKDAKSKAKELNRLQKKINNLKEKNGKEIKSMNNIIANGVKYGVIDRMKIKAKMLQEKLKNKYYENRIEKIEEKGR